MLTTFVALGAFIAGVGVTAAVARYYFLMGWELAHDDRRLEPGAVGSLPSRAPEVPDESVVEVTGPIRSVGGSSGRHAKVEWALPFGWTPPEDMPVQDEVTT